MTDPSSTPLFEIRDLHVRFGVREVLRGIDLDIDSRQVTSLLGPSGCGKSTLLRTLNRTLELIPTARIHKGSIRFRGEDLHSHPQGARTLRKRIGIVQQRPLPFPMSIRENVLFGTRFHEHLGSCQHDEVVERNLRRVGLWNETRDRLKAPAKTLSIGQQQRLCCARSLANDPEVLLMDEPSSALDPASTARIEEMILGLAGQVSVVIVTHLPAQARRVSTRCVVLLDGKVAEQGETAQVLESPVHPGVQAIVQG